MIEQEKKKITKQEISAGFVVYRKTREGMMFLLLYHGGSYWNFPKGKIESEERSFETALRETHEETGLRERDLKISRNFKAHERFTFRRQGHQIFKTVIFYLAETWQAEIKISKKSGPGKEHHNGYAWFLYRDAKNIMAKYKDSLRVLDQANSFLRRSQDTKRHLERKPSR